MKNLLLEFHKQNQLILNPLNMKKQNALYKLKIVTQ